MAETVLVTGGSGYIAGWCIVELLRRGYTVRTTLRSLSKEAAVRAAIAGEVDPGGRLSFFAAELTSADGWDAAVAGCDYVLHVASPLGTGVVKDPDVLIVPAREGTIHVLRAAIRAGVKRTVLTSSVAAAGGIGTEEVRDETHWTDLTRRGVHAYREAKTIAERAAWELVAAEGDGMELATVLPSMVIGPVLTAENLGSVQVVSRLLSGKLPGTARIGFTLTDVRDVADLHIRAMTMPQAAGERFIAATGFRWMAEIARILRERLGPRAAKVPRRGIPDWVVRLMSLFDPALRYVTPSLGHSNTYSSAKAQELLGWKPRPVEDSIADCAESLIAKGAG
ncbi:SDR family oxidoreductase [Sphingomonas canadensis]|uniref:SDR family oxidoreductase n=1 Tax=Sphingomonas canadensis TaxID=1219257 RepID=A0ABW3HAZ5_9SPHN|nr:aldehyde reductase [Sphingomonas canadensis]MCW3836607.1 aldehyde reductase [Sphingomonas canadensis]